MIELCLKNLLDFIKFISEPKKCLLSVHLRFERSFRSFLFGSAFVAFVAARGRLLGRPGRCCFLLLRGGHVHAGGFLHGHQELLLRLPGQHKQSEAPI